MEAPRLSAVRPAGRGPCRILAYCHDSVGVGHLRRTLAICEKLNAVRSDCTFLLATGSPYVPLFRPPASVDYIKLPALTKTPDGDYRSKFLSMDLKQVLRCREALILEAARSFRPDLLLVDKAPVGVCGELLPTLRWLHAHRPEVPLIFGMRDVEDEPQATVRQWQQSGAFEAFETCFEEIWVYGSQSLYDVGQAYHLPEPIRAKLFYTGYVARPPCGHPLSPGDEPTLLVTVGGGTDGERILHDYLDQAARRAAGRGVRSLLVGGPDLPSGAAARLRAQAARTPGVQWLDFTGCMSCQIRQARWIVTMGGYNTLCELAVQRKPALVVPRMRPRLEQRIRAELWQQRGAVRMLPDDAHSPDGLARCVEELIDTAPERTTHDIDLAGLDRIVQRMTALLARDSTATDQTRREPRPARTSATEKLIRGPARPASAKRSAS